MKVLKDFEKDLSKCSKCGLCESVCPLFKIIPNDCVASKGKFIMLHGVTKGELKLSKKINHYIDLCLKCGKCNDFCPSDIDICNILSVAKAQYLNERYFNNIIRFFQSRLVFNNLIKLGQILSKPFRPVSKHNEKLSTVIYFKGCVNQICPNTDRYIQKIFKNRINIVEPNFECCGLPFLSEGNIERFEQAAKNNLKLFNKDCDYIVTDCASCSSTINSYPKYIDNCKALENKLFLNWGDIIAKQDLKFKFKKPLRVTFHKPCHLKDDGFFEKIIKNCENVEYVKMDEYDSCCGMAGSFALKNPELFFKLSKIKGENIKKTNADSVITTCPACILGLKFGLFNNNSKIKVVSLLEFLSKASN